MGKYLENGLWQKPSKLIFLPQLGQIFFVENWKYPCRYLTEGLDCTAFWRKGSAVPLFDESVNDTLRTWRLTELVVGAKIGFQKHFNGAFMKDSCYFCLCELENVLERKILSKLISYCSSTSDSSYRGCSVTLPPPRSLRAVSRTRVLV